MNWSLRMVCDNCEMISVRRREQGNRPEASVSTGVVVRGIYGRHRSDTKHRRQEMAMLNWSHRVERWRHPTSSSCNTLGIQVGNVSCADCDRNCKISPTLVYTGSSPSPFVKLPQWHSCGESRE